MALSFSQIEYTIPIRYSQVDTKAQKNNYILPGTSNNLITTENIVKEQNQIIMDSIFLESAKKDAAESRE